MSNASGVYVFCVIREKQPQKFGTVMMNGRERPIYTLHYENAAMVVCPVDGEVLPNRENLFAHQNIVSKVIEKYYLIPMSFGNVFHTAEDVLFIAEHLYDQFDSLFPQLENKIEVRLKVNGNQQWLQKEIEKDPVLQRWKQEANKKSTAAAFYDRITVGEMAQKFFLSLQQKMEREVYSPLSELTESSKLNKPITEKMLLNATFLVDRRNESGFDAQRSSNI
ncbi:GvpL/GvpF family gas vesicle protein [Ammoniphilus sp. 3BR4]|uniref:GvpL/GvpF family gas vesicle protein n=1 Tax=Ammoniphilus sp. 3BR4 TaxID=3158265 RepID=UPI003466AD5E